MKFYTVDKEINGKKYTAQFNGISAALKSVDETYIPGTNTTSIEKMAAYVLKNVIVEPGGLTPDDFDSADELNEVVRFGTEVMQGNFRPEADAGKAEGKSKA